MDNLLFTALLIALAYYFLVHAKKTSPNLQTASKDTQTETSPTESDMVEFPNPKVIKQLEADQAQKEEELSAKQRTIHSLRQSYQKLETAKNQALQQHQQQISTLQTRITQLTQSQTSEQKSLEQTLDQLLKNINEISKVLD